MDVLCITKEFSTSYLGGLTARLESTRILHNAVDDYHELVHNKIGNELR